MKDNERMEKIHNQFYGMIKKVNVVDDSKLKKLKIVNNELEFCFWVYENIGEVKKCENLLKLLKNNTFNKDTEIRFYLDKWPRDVEICIHNLYRRCNDIVKSYSPRRKSNLAIMDDLGMDDLGTNDDLERDRF